jgi:hypothetical protein
MSTNELSPEQEEQLVDEMLRERGGIDPDRLGPDPGVDVGEDGPVERL